MFFCNKKEKIVTLNYKNSFNFESHFISLSDTKTLLDFMRFVFKYAFISEIDNLIQDASFLI